LSVKNRCKPSLKINNPVAAEIFGLFVSHALQRLLSLHDGDRVLETLQVFRQTALIGSAKKPIGQGLRVVVGNFGWKVGIFRGSSQFDNCLRPQHAIQVLVQQNFGKTLEQFFIESHKKSAMEMGSASPANVQLNHGALQDDTPPYRWRSLCAPRSATRLS
jgi:hypothetical protein